jgi:hypothetical protein
MSTSLKICRGWTITRRLLFLPETLFMIEKRRHSPDQEVINKAVKRPVDNVVDRNTKYTKHATL